MSNAVMVQDFDLDKIELMKQTVARGVTDMEFELFLHACKRTGLDPLMKQIHAIKRWDSRLQREAMSIQTGIDGYRLIADRTGNYAPGPKPSFTYDAGGAITSATAYIKKRTADGVWHVVEGEAFWDEYVQMTKQGEVTSMWRKGHMMLAKCAEALALRKAFPAELSGVYTHEEMMQAENHQDKKPLRTGAEMLEKIEAKKFIEKTMDRFDPDYEANKKTITSHPLTTTAPPMTTSSVHEPAVEEVMEDIEKAAALSMPTNPAQAPQSTAYAKEVSESLPPISSVFKDWEQAPDEAAKIHIVNEALMMKEYSQADRQWLIGKVKGKKK